MVTRPPLENVNIATQGIVPLITPAHLKRELPITDQAQQTVIKGRQEIIKILSGHSNRLLVIIGPCSIHDPIAALDYAKRLVKLTEELPRLMIVMRVYFEKPRTTTGWKGLLNEPDPGNGFEIERGLRIARQLLIDINELGISVATEFLDPIVPQYLADLVAWGAIGARTTESQTHRQMASGLSMPIGFKNTTDGNVQTAVDAIIAARAASSFLGISSSGQIAIVNTTGNVWGHLVLRGGHRPNYYARYIKTAAKVLGKVDGGCLARLLVDCSHANSRSAKAAKDYTKQARVLRYVVRQIRQGISCIAGVMLESNLFEGSQKLGGELKYGVSITDACIGWEETAVLLREANSALTSQPSKV